MDSFNPGNLRKRTEVYSSKDATPRTHLYRLLLDCAACEAPIADAIRENLIVDWMHPEQWNNDIAKPEHALGRHAAWYFQHAVSTVSCCYKNGLAAIHTESAVFCFERLNNHWKDGFEWLEGSIQSKNSQSSKLLLPTSCVLSILV